MIAGDDTIRVLHVDDDPTFGEMVARVLERESDRFDVTTVLSTPDGLERLATDDFDCVVSDYDMPRQNGIEFLRSVRAEYADLPFILYTGKGSEEIASEAISAGVTDYVQKDSGPEQYELLANRITNAVEEARARDRVAQQGRILRILREADQALVTSTTRSDITDAITRILASFEPYRLAWIGEYDAERDRVVLDTAAGAGDERFSALPLSDQSDGPVSEALRTDDPARTRHPDRTLAVWDADHDGSYAEGIVVPLVYQGDRYGLLTLYAHREGAFDAEEREMLTELAGDVAHALHTAETHRRLRRHRTAVESVPEGVFVLDEDGTIELVNERVGDLVGRPIDELEGRPFPTFVDQGLFDEGIIDWYLASVREMLSASSDTQEARYETELHLPEAGRRLIEIHVTLRPYDEEFRGTVGIVQDITERRERELRYEAIFNQTYQFTGLLDPDGTLLEANQTALDFGGLDRADVIDKPFWETYWWQIDDETQQELRRAIERASNGEFVRYDVEVQGDEGTILIDFSIRPVIDDDGEVRYLIPEGRNITELAALRERERELERRNELFRKAQDIAAVGAWEYDLRTEDLTWTEEVYAIHGLSTAFDPTPETAIEFYHPDDRATIREAFNRAIEDGEPYDLELRLVTESGEERWVRTRGDPHTDDGSVVRVRGTIQDITERKTADERLRALTNSFPDLAFIIDEDGHHVEHIAGPDSQALLVAEAESLIGHSLHDVMPTDRADELLGVVTATLATGEPQSIEYQLDVKAGTTWFEARTAPLRTRIDGKRAVTWVARDISDRKEREQVLRELHAIATDLPSVESPAAICQRTVDAAESVLEFDNCVVYLAEDGELRVTALSEAFPAEDFTSMPIEGSLAGESYRTGESFVVDDADSHPIADPQGPYASGVSVPIGEHGVCQMIAKPEGAFDAEDLELAELLVSHTEQALDRLTREAELREQNGRLDEFVSIVSHDLRNPLNVAQGRLELASEECASEHLEDAATAVDRSLTLIEELLTLARQGEQVGDVEPVDLAATVESCWRTVDTANATLVTETERTVHADQNRLKQLLENLFRNAVEHGGDGVTITIGDLAGGFYVADDGPGIPADKREQVFEAGYSTSEDETGFGLNIVREIADAHGWTVTATESEAGGARFEITGVAIA